MCSHKEAMKAWRLGNDKGEGFPVGAETDSLEAAAQRENLTILQRFQNGSLVTTDGVSTIMVCHVYGPWAVTIGR